MLAAAQRAKAPSLASVGISEHLFGIAVGGMEFEPRGCSPERAVTGKIRNGRQVAASNLCTLLHPARVVLNVLSHLRPAACEVTCLVPPSSHFTLSLRPYNLMLSGPGASGEQETPAPGARRTVKFPTHRNSDQLSALRCASDHRDRDGYGQVWAAQLSEVRRAVHH
jgi:hypothetical protein